MNKQQLEEKKKELQDCFKTILSLKDNLTETSFANLKRAISQAIAEIEINLMEL